MAVLVVHSCRYADLQVLSKLTRFYQTENNSKLIKWSPRVSFVIEICAKPTAEGSSMNINCHFPLTAGSPC